jgi:hypothetical protein
LVVNRVGAKPSAVTARRDRKHRLDNFIIVVFVVHERSELDCHIMDHGRLRPKISLFLFIVVGCQRVRDPFC